MNIFNNYNNKHEFYETIKEIGGVKPRICSKRFNVNHIESKSKYLGLGTK